VSAPILVGDGAAILRRAVGLIPGTSFPDQPGNCAVAGHRDSYFRGLEHVRPGDEVEVETRTGSFDYRVVWTKVVDPKDTWVLEPVKGESTLTLVTCYPFRWIGHAPHRFVVRAVRETVPPASSSRAKGPSTPS